MANKNALPTLPSNLPVLDGKNWSRWVIQMKVVLGYQEVLEIVTDGFPVLSEASTAAERTAFKENKKKDCKAMFILHQCVDDVHFEKIAAASSSHEAWEILETSNEGAAKVRKVKLQTMRRQYELMAMENHETVADFFNRITVLTNAMKAYGEAMKDLTIVEKILRCLTPKFDHVVVAMEESGKIEKMTVAELQGSLEAQEQRLLERTTDKPVDQALQAQVQKKGGSRNKGNRGKNKNKENKGNSGKSSQDDHDHADSSSRKGGGSSFKGNGK